MPLSRLVVSASVRLPESFRGGCSFGTNLLGSPNVDEASLPVNCWQARDLSQSQTTGHLSLARRVPFTTAFAAFFGRRKAAAAWCRADGLRSGLPGGADQLQDSAAGEVRGGRARDPLGQGAEKAAAGGSLWVRDFGVPRWDSFAV